MVAEEEKRREYARSYRRRKRLERDSGLGIQSSYIPNSEGRASDSELLSAPLGDAAAGAPSGGSEESTAPRRLPTRPIIQDGALEQHRPREEGLNGEESDYQYEGEE
jgi:hypothetical protein